MWAKAHNYSIISIFSELSSYAAGLPSVQKQRYMEKIKVIGNVDPYRVYKEPLWCTKNDKLPSLTIVDMYKYLVLQKNFYDHAEMGCYKSLHSYNNFKCGWVYVCEVSVDASVIHNFRVKNAH